MAKKTLIVADIGINHNGHITAAERLVDACTWVGADIIKFQTVNPDLVYKKGSELYEIFEKVQLEMGAWQKLKKRVKKNNKEFMSTPGEKQSAKFLDMLGVERFKIASDSAADVDFVNYVASFGKPFIVSTGMVDFKTTVKLMQKYDRLPQYLLHCVSKYPTPMKNAGLDRIRVFKDAFGADMKIGYSDHVPGYDASLAAVAMGAEMIEKHIKWDDRCVDAPVSLNPIEFKEMVDKIRELEEML